MWYWYMYGFHYLDFINTEGNLNFEKYKGAFKMLFIKYLTENALNALICVAWNNDYAVTSKHLSWNQLQTVISDHYLCPI